MKDKENLLTYNQWTGTDYNQDNTDFTLYSSSYASKVSSKNYSDIGENSLKITKLKSTSAWCRAYYNNSINSKTVTGSVTVNATSKVQIVLDEIKNSTTLNLVSVNIPSNTVEKITLSLTSGSENTRFAIHANPKDDIGSYFYIDNLKLTVS